MSKTFKEKLQTDIILLDGAFGTYIQEIGLKEEHFGKVPGCMEYLSIASPDMVTRIHLDYLEAGSDAVETNTFGANSIKLSEYGLGDKVYDINVTSAKLARKTADKYSSDGQERYVVGTMGPTGKLPSSYDPVMGNITYKRLKEVYYEQALALIDGGADALLIETGQDLMEMKAAVNGAKAAIGYKRKDLAVLAQCTLANNGRMLLGTEVSAVMTVMEAVGADVVGLNCSTGPLEMESGLKFLNANSKAFISCVPNAGMPIEKNGKVSYPLKSDEMSKLIKRFMDEYRINVIGGCCGTTPEHIREMRSVIDRPKDAPGRRASFCAGFYSGIDLTRAERPIKVGERINTQGSRKMKKMLIAEDHDGIVEMGKLQQKQGADILDVCAVLTERDTESRDAVTIIRRLGESVQVPVMIDSTDAEVIEAVLENYPGTALINSVNLEDGGEKARRIFSLAKEHGSFVICLAIDEKGMGKTVQRKIDISERLYGMAVRECGVDPSRLIFDMLTFTLGTGENEYRDSGMNTFEAIRTFKKTHPEVFTSLGVSNVSFGLTPASREILNMSFLGNAVKCGLDIAIIDPSKYISYTDIPVEDRKMAEDLIFNKKSDTLERFIRHFSDRSPGPSCRGDAGEEKTLTVEERIKKCVIERDKTSILGLLEEAMETRAAEYILNDILMNAMKDVGEKLNSGELVLPYVLQSAEVMKKGIEYLEKFVRSDKSPKRGKVLLATVFGDVHDIGKNLVRMILENNGFSVIDLGKQVPVEKIVAEARKHKVDAVGLSALLVSTARHMKTCVQAMHDAGLDHPVLIGGAPTNRYFAKEISLLKDGSVYPGGVFYSKDAFSGLATIQALKDPSGKRRMMEEYRQEKKDKSPQEAVDHVKTPRSMNKGTKGEVPIPPFFGTRVLVNLPADEIFERLDRDVLFRSAWGIKMKDE
ncbi:MAG: homocysteine S-methyltransferase family protein, partial [Candidatus Omnitrophica bacterium]|nr:homocysteine S-methyltransferase family protein [Candidatus Omnitrophota bacterium]